MLNAPVINTLINVLSYGCIGLGLVFWFWGTWPLVGDRSVLYKLHSLSIADTLGSLSIVAGLLLKIPREWPLLLLAIFSLALWNTMLGYVLAYCASEPSAEERRGSAPEFANTEFPDTQFPDTQFPDTLMSDRAELGDL